MAKNDNFDFGDENLDDLDFGDLDFGGDDPFAETKDDRKPVEHAKEAFKSTIRNKLTDPSFFKRLIRSAVPKGYVQAMDAYDALDSSIADIMKDNQSELNPYMLKMQKKLDTNPAWKRLIPKSVKEAASLATDNSDQDSGPDELTTNLNGLNELLKTQAYDKAEGKYTEAVKEVRDQKRFAASMKVEVATAKGIGRLVGYQDTILINYHRKSLEIGYRQLDIGVRTLKAQLEFFSGAKRELENITKNTGLPDFVKMRTKEVLEQQLKQKLAQSIAGSAGGYAKKLFGGIKDNASQLLGGALDFHQQLGEAESFGKSKAQMTGSILGNMAGEFVGEKVEGLAGAGASKLRPQLERIPGVKKLSNILRMVLTDPGALINDFAKSDTDYDSKYGLGVAGLKALVDTHSASSSITGQRYDELDETAKFDTLFHKSVTEVIPAQLASIDRWVKTMATGKDQEETAYSHYTGSLVKRSTLNQQHLNIAMKEGGNAYRNAVDQVLTEMGAKELSAEARRVFRMRLLSDFQENLKFDAAKYGLDKTFEGDDPATVHEITDFMKAKFNLADEGTADKIANVNDVYTSAKNSLQDVGTRMNLLTQVTGRRAWRDLGVAGYDGKQGDNIDLKAAYKLLLQGDEGDLTKKDKVQETAVEKAKRLLREEREKQNKARGVYDVESDDDLRGSFSTDRTPRPAPPPGPVPPTPVPPIPSPYGPPPVVIKPEIEWPALFQTNDEETHKRLDSLLAIHDTTNQMFDHLLKNGLPYNGGGGGGGDDEEGEGDPDAGGGGRRRWRDATIGGFLGGAARKGFGAAKFAAKGLGKYFKFTYGTIGKGIGLGAKVAKFGATIPFKRLDGFGVSDIHVMGEAEPRMTATKIRKGMYFDVGTQKVITKLSDITGAVKDREGNEVISAEEFASGLYSGKGASLAGALGRASAAVGKFGAKGLASYFSFTYGTMWKVAKKVINIAAVQFLQFDAYFPGDEEPRIRSTLMKKGYYRDKDGTPIFKLDDIKGPVFDINNNEIISQEEIDKYKSFYTRNGSLLFTIGRGAITVGTKAAQLAAKAALGYAKFVGKAYKGAWNLTKKVVSWIWKKTFGRMGKNGGVGMLDDEMATASVEIAVEQLKIQTSIYDLLKRVLDKQKVHGDGDGDGVRDYSWADILRRRKEKAVAKDGGGGGGDGRGVVDAINKLNKNLDDKLDELIDTTEEAGESSLLEDAADLSDLKGNKHGRGGRAKPKRGFRSGKGIRGKIGKIGGKLGRGLGRATGGLGRAAMTAGRFAVSGGGTLLRGAAMAAPALISGAATVGSAALTAGGAILSGAATVGSAIIGAIGLPVLLGVAAVAGIGYLGYRWYKSNEAKKYPLLYLRMTQYGVSPTSQDRVEKMITLEGLCKGAIRISPDGTAAINPEGIDMDAFGKLFSTDGADAHRNLMKWLMNRFRPIFCAHCAAMNKIRGTTDLVSADSGIGDGDIETFLSTVDLANMQSVYDDTDSSPFDSSLDCDADDVESAIKMVRAKRKEKKEDAKDAAVAGVVAGSAAKVAANTTLSVGKVGQTPEEIAAGIKLAPPLLGAAGAYQQRAAAQQLKKTAGLDIPTAVRYKTYGLVELKLDKCEQLQKAEEIYWDKIQYSGTDKAMISGNSDELQHQIMDLFKPATDADRADLVNWLEKRFIPTILQYAISVRRRFNGSAKDAVKNLTGVLMKEVLNETTAAITQNTFGSTSVWAIANSPWPGVVLESMPGSVKLYIDAIDVSTESKVLTPDGMKVAAATNPENTSYQNRLVNTALGNTTGNGNMGNIGKTGPTLANYGKIYGSGAIAGGVAGQSTTGQGTGALLMAGSYGSKVEHPGGGTGGDINSIPDGQGKGVATMGPIVTAAAKMVGFDSRIALQVAGTESNFDPKVDNGTAAGLFQFTKGTWSDCLRKYGATYGISPNTPRTDARANAILGICYLKENFEGLQSTLGGNVTDLDLYTAHFLGLGGAKRFLSAPRDQPASSYVGEKAVANNASIFYANNGKPGMRMRTVGEALAELQRRMNIGLKKAGLPASGEAAPAGVPTETPAAGEPKASAYGAMDNANAEEGPTTVGAAEAAASAATAAAAPVAAANLGAGGSQSQAPAAPMPMSVANTINAPVAGSDAPSPSPAIPQAPAPSASRAAAESSQATQVAQAAASSDAITPWLEKTFNVAVESRDFLKEIRDKLDAIATAAAQAKQGSATPPTPMKEPTPRNPLVTQRPNAVIQ